VSAVEDDGKVLVRVRVMGKSIWTLASPADAARINHDRINFAITKPATISDIQKKRGRPAIGKGEPVLVRLRPELEAKLDTWINRKCNRPSRPEAIRQLVEKALAPKKRKAKGRK
jgi:hypothetical protein